MDNLEYLLTDLERYIGKIELLETSTHNSKNRLIAIFMRKIEYILLELNDLNK